MLNETRLAGTRGCLSAKEFYDRLAVVYDRRWAYHPRDTAKHTAWLLRVCPKGPLLDLGCGTGRMLPGLAAAGFQPVGLDISMSMLLAGRRKSVKNRLVRAAMGHTLPFASESFSTVICLHATAIHLTDQAQLKSLAAEAWRVLRPGGALVVELPHPCTYPSEESRGRWVEFFSGISCKRINPSLVSFRLDHDPTLNTLVRLIRMEELVDWLCDFTTIHLYPGFHGGRFNPRKGEIMLVCAWK
jgi:ubiquinone/menaquinone biosynthesis C-methylase UbiE